MAEINSSNFLIRVLDCYDSKAELFFTDNNLKNLISSSKTPAPSLKRYWLHAFTKHYGATRKQATSLVYKGESLCAVLPFQLKGEDSIEFLCDETSDYNDFFYQIFDLDALDYALNFWVRNGIKEFNLKGLPFDSKTIGFLYQIGVKNHWDVVISDHDSIPYVDAQYNKRISEWNGVKPNQVKRYQRKLKALHTMADVSFTFINSNSQLIEEFGAIKDIHIKRWDILGIESKYSDQRRENFIIDVCKAAIRDNSLFFPLMKINGQLASYIIGFKYEDTIYDWNTSFSIEYRKWSPGALLLLHILSNSYELGFKKYNFLKGNESHKFIWTDKIERNKSVLITIS